MNTHIVLVVGHDGGGRVFRYGWLLVCRRGADGGLGIGDRGSSTVGLCLKWIVDVESMEERLRGCAALMLASRLPSWYRPFGD